MNQRFYSLDVFRGATVALMILVNNPGSWSHIFEPLDHAKWNGCTLTDLVFPFFLFAVGNALAFVMPKFETNNSKMVWQKIIKRSLIIFCIGLFLNWFPFVKYNNDGAFVAKPFENLRFFGVLQRIAICYFLASSIIYVFKIRGAFVASACLLLGYWVLCLTANSSQPFSMAGWFGTTFDLKIFGETHLYHGEGVAFDPESFFSSFAAISQVIFGYLVGHYILQKGKSMNMLKGLLAVGSILILTGIFWDFFFPINKKIWTSSYTVFTTGLAIFVLVTFMYLIEIKNIKSGLFKFFDVFGKNALFIFTLSGLLPRLLGLIRIQNGVNEKGVIKFLTPLGWFYEHICKPILPSEPRLGSFIYALFFIALMWFCAWLLDRKKIYIKV